ncbi:hypothetical protein LDENG_00118830 [Lucifuga dentata]|nr:hypothetical protein LDENG_00118830 [Lucifuga dentata]
MSCLSDIKCWMSNNFLQLNDSTTEILITTPSGPFKISDQLTSSLGSLSAYVKSEVRNLGVIFDSSLSFNAQLTKVIQTCFLKLRHISKIRSFFFFFRPRKGHPCIYLLQS